MLVLHRAVQRVVSVKEDVVASAGCEQRGYKGTGGRPHVYTAVTIIDVDFVAIGDKETKRIARTPHRYCGRR